MKIIELTTFFHPVIGGVETHVENLAQQLDAMGHEVEILTSDSNKSGPRIEERNGKLGNVKVKRFRSWFSMTYFHKFFPGVFWYLLTHDFDVVHVHSFRKVESYIALLVAKLKKKPVVLTTHNPFPTSTRPDNVETLIKWHDKTFGKWFTKYFDAIIILVESERKIFEEEYQVEQERLHKVPNGLDEKFFEQVNPEGFLKYWEIDANKWRAIVVAGGRMNKTKGFQNLKQAADELKDVLFFFGGGDDGYLPKLQRIFEENDNVIFSEHFLSQEKIREMFAAGDLFVMPSLHEPFGIMLLEAMAQGLPVLATNKGGPVEFVKESFGKTLEPRDEQAWSTAIKQLLDDPQTMKSMSEAAVMEAKKYTWPKITKKILKIFNEVVTVNAE